MRVHEARNHQTIPAIDHGFNWLTINSVFAVRLNQFVCQPGLDSADRAAIDQDILRLRSVGFA